MLRNLGAGTSEASKILPGNGVWAFFYILPIEGVHYAPQGAGLGQFVTKQPDRVFIGRRGPEIEVQEPHSGQLVADHELHHRVAEIVLHLKD